MLSQNSSVCFDPSLNILINKTTSSILVNGTLVPKIDREEAAIDPSVYITSNNTIVSNSWYVKPRKESNLSKSKSRTKTKSNETATDTRNGADNKTVDIIIETENSNYDRNIADNNPESFSEILNEPNEPSSSKLSLISTSGSVVSQKALDIVANEKFLKSSTIVDILKKTEEVLHSPEEWNALIQSRQFQEVYVYYHVYHNNKLIIHYFHYPIIGRH